MHEPGPPQGGHVAIGHAQPPAGVPAQVGDGRGVAEAVRRFQVDEVRDRRERLVELLGVDRDRQRRLGVDHRVPRADVVEAGQDHLALVADHVGQRGIELLSRRRRATSRARPRRPGGGPPRRSRPAPRGARPSARPRRSFGRASRGRPTARRRARPPPARLGQAQLLGQRDGEGGVVVDHGVHVAASRERELESDPEPVQRRVARADHAHAGRHHARGPGSYSYLIDLSAMSSPNHLACSWASVWQPTLTAARCSRRQRATPRPGRPARPAAARSGTGAGRAPSAGRSRGRCPARALRPAPPGEPVGDLPGTP